MLALPLVACRTNRPPGADTDAPASAVTPVIDQLRRGEYESAHALLGELLVDACLLEAAGEFANGTPEIGLLAVDEALKLAPRRVDVLRAKAAGSLQLAELGIARGGTALLIEGSLADAFEFYQALAPEPAALLGASRSALLLGNTADALRCARLADEALRDAPEPSDLAFVPERVLAEATFRAYMDLRLSEGPEPELATLFDETRDALARLLGRSAGDPWVWGQTADLYEWDERFDEAEETLRRGLARNPESAELYERLARVTRKNGGGERTMAVFEGLIESDPSLALPNWYAGLERFDIATADLMDRFTEEEAPHAPELVAAFQRAEREFQSCRAIEAGFEGACRGYEVMCRGAVGWYHYQSGAYEDALSAFLSMSDVMPRGVEWAIEGRLLAGISGLHLIGTGYNDRQDWAAAADVYQSLHELQPDSSVWANNSGFFYRDAAVELEALGQQLCRAVHGRVEGEEQLASLRAAANIPPDAHGTADETRIFAQAAEGVLARARALMNRSAKSYSAAAHLAPNDVRIVNDAALVLVYYTHADIDLAERMLLDCVSMGAQQSQDESLDEDALWELRNAWGDAHQNLGVLYANLKDDPREAERWFVKSVEIGPEPRPLLSNFWLPLVRGELDSDQDDELFALQTWGQPCAAKGNR